MSDQKIQTEKLFLEISSSEKEAAAKELELASLDGVRILSFFDEDYPKRLKELPSPPLLLWAKGDLSLLEKTIGVVGTRNASLYGKSTAKGWSKEAARRGVSIVSGLARGIDTEAHLGAMESGKTIAIIGSGFKSLYPKENEELAKKIGNEGLLLSAYPMMAPPARFQFPERNKLIAALSEKLLVIEAPLKSGSLLTAEEALKLKRPLFAVPGRIDWESFLGNHLLLKEGKAKLATSIDDLCEGNVPIYPAIYKGDPEETLLAFFKGTEQHLETLLQVSGLPPSLLNAKLMRLVLQKKICQLPGGLYKVII